MEGDFSDFMVDAGFLPFLSSFQHWSQFLRNVGSWTSILLPLSSPAISPQVQICGSRKNSHMFKFKVQTSCKPKSTDFWVPYSSFH
jgi:hypothetical protein